MKRGPEEEEEFGVFPFYPCLPLLLIASSLPSVSVCQSGGTAGVGQSVNAADSPRRLLGDQRRKAPGGSLSFTSEVEQGGYAKREQNGVKAGRLKNERARVEWEGAAAPGAAAARGEDNALSVKVTDET